MFKDIPEGRPEVAPSLMEVINVKMEKFLSDVHRGKLDGRSKRSLSTTVACSMLRIMQEVVAEYQRHEAQRDSYSSQRLRMSCRADAVATDQVRRLMGVISCVGATALRAQFAPLLLMNVTRRVLSLIRAVAADNTASLAELELLAAQRLDEAEAADINTNDGTDSVQPSPDRSGEVSAVGLFSPLSALRTDERRQVSFRTRRAVSLRLPVLSTACSRAELENVVDARAVSTNISGVGIPGEQSLRRAPSRREVDEEERGAEFPVRVDDFFDSLQESLRMLHDEIAEMCDDLCARASRQLHPTDTVMTINCSYTTRRFFLSALQAVRRFKVIILEGTSVPLHVTHAFAAELRRNGAEVQVLPDSSAFAVMGTCTKVLVGVDNVLANGGMLAAIGTHPLCIVAKHFAVPVLVATTTLKMTPYYPRDVLCTSLVKISRTDAKEIPWNTYGSPCDVFPTPYGENVKNIGSFNVNTPLTEYVPPELIRLYATNESEYTPSQIHRIVRENYNPED